MASGVSVPIEPVASALLASIGSIKNLVSSSVYPNVFK